MRIAIVDDNKTEQERLSALIRAWAQDKAVITETFDSGEAFAEALQRNRYEIVWMDIIMDGKNGIETARRLRESSMETLLVFITSSPEFMAQAFPCHAFDYVMKPYAPQRVFEVLSEARRALGRHGEVLEIAGDKFLLSDILYIYSDSNYCEIHTRHGVRRERVSFSALSEQLVRHPSFAVVSRGAAVNFDNTSHISGLVCVMPDGDRVPVSRRRIKEVEQAFLDRQFSKLLSEGE